MSSMDIDPPDEKENIPAMPSLETGIPTGPVTEMKDSKSHSTKEQVSKVSSSWEIMSCELMRCRFKGTSHRCRLRQTSLVMSAKRRKSR